MRLTGMTNTTDNPNPLILLDIDGVINDLNALGGLDRDWGIDQVYSHGHMVHIPDYMGWLIRQLTDVAEVHWCTTWRHRANDEIAEHLGIEQLPVVDDGTRSRFVDWKAAAAHDLAEAAIKAGRKVLWIEDFYGHLPIDEMPKGVEFVDTAANDEMVLEVEMLPGGYCNSLTPPPSADVRDSGAELLRNAQQFCTRITRVDTVEA
jgi:hypothetical protein